MACSNCFNGCAEIVSDKCVKYTGIDIPGLGIENGDNLLTVENKITEKILTLMDGTGIYPKLDPVDVCALVQNFLPCCPPLNLNVVLTAFLKAICDINTRLDALKDRVIVVEDKLVALNADYIIGCLTGVTASSDTHEIVQATIDKVCAVAIDLSTNYVRIADLDTFIANYLAALPTSSLFSAKMVPYVPVPYFGPLSNYPNPGDTFDGTGAGQGAWARVFLCNGQNPSVPDLRGWTLVGANTMSIAPYADVRVQPGGANPNYGQGTKAGFNQAFLTDPTQLPPHNHSVTIDATVSLTGAIQHVSESFSANGSASGIFTKNDGFNDNRTPATVNNEDTAGFTINANHTHTAVVGTTGASAGHANIQPSYGTNYIIYIP